MIYCRIGLPIGFILLYRSVLILLLLVHTSSM